LKHLEKATVPSVPTVPVTGHLNGTVPSDCYQLTYGEIISSVPTVPAKAKKLSFVALEEF
jgi:hypothetical protein